MFTKFFSCLTAIIQLVTFLINKYNEKRLEDKLEEVRNDPASGWVDGFGVRREKNSDPSSPHSKQ